MSGSDSGYSTGIGGSGNSGTFACDTLAFETLLSSPKADVINKFGIGEILQIAIITTNGIEIVVAIFEGEIAGGLVNNQDRIKDCIDLGFAYTAEVREKNGAKVKVFVKCS